MARERDDDYEDDTTDRPARRRDGGGGGETVKNYLVQSILYWNRTAESPIDVTVYDNYIRGIPPWLSALAGTAHVTLVKHEQEADRAAVPLPREAR